MDSLTHLALGHAMGLLATGASPAAQTAAYWGAFVGNSLPDIDVPVGHLLGKGWGLHRKFTHTAPGVLVLSILAAGVITWAVPGSNPLLTFGWTLAGCVVHVFLDCLNTFGTRPFWPFSNQILGYGVLFILDPLILGAIGLGSVAQQMGWITSPFLVAMYMLMWVYVAARWLMLPRLKNLVNQPGTERYSLTPFLLGWRFFRVRQGRLEMGKVGFFGTRVTESVVSARGPAVDASRQVPEVEAFLQRARFPVARVEEREGLYRVEWEDVFGRLRGRRGGIAVTLNADFQPVEH